MGGGAPRRPKRQPAQLGWGGYDWPERTTARTVARMNFFAALRAEEPQVLADLAGLPLTLHREALLQTPPGASRELELSLERGEALADWGPPFRALQVQLEAWGQRYGLAIPWCLAWALGTLHAWHLRPAAAGKDWLHEVPDEADLFTDDELRFSFADPGWHPLWATWKQYEVAAREHFDATLRLYHAYVERLATEKGYAPTEEVRAPEHYTWLVWHHVRGWSYAKIADTVMYQRGEDGNVPDQTTIEKPVRRLARLIDLPSTRHGKHARN